MTIPSLPPTTSSGFVVVRGRHVLAILFILMFYLVSQNHRDNNPWSSQDNSNHNNNPVRSSQWSLSNPNVLRMQYTNGKTKEIKVTKRATERTESTVFSSEFQLVTQDDDRGIPVIFPRRVVTKWRTSISSSDSDTTKNNDDDTAIQVVEGLEIVYDMTNGDANNAQQQPPNILSKSRIVLQRSF